MRIIVAPNALKGSLSAIEAAQAMKRGICAVIPSCDVICVPIADGGDGFMEVLQEALSGEIIEMSVMGPRMELLGSGFCLVESQKLAVIEMAKSSGLALLAKEEQDPTQTSTYGTGELIRAALDRGAKRIVVGLGGSATCDGGIGMAAALGYRFLDEHGTAVLPVGGSLRHIRSIDRSGVDSRLQQVSFEGLCDVTNPLTGPDGASYVYSPQKGASPSQVRELDEGLQNLADIVLRDMSIDIGCLAGAGAAGGLGAGLCAFVGGRLKKGIDLVLEIVQLRDKIIGADLVLTSEGQIDFQTVFDKAPAGVARAAKGAGVPCIAICGGVGERIDELYKIGMGAVFSLCKGPQTLESAMEDGQRLLSHTTEQVVRAFLLGRKNW